MNLSIIYIFVLFVLLANNTLFSRFLWKNKPYPTYLVNALIFAVIFYYTYDYVRNKQIESMILFNNSNNLEDKITEKTKNNDNAGNWVIVPPMKEDTETPPDFEEIPVQCAANYNESKACCGQPPAIIPFENTCTAEKPLCTGYVENSEWGTCGR